MAHSDSPWVTLACSPALWEADYKREAGLTILSMFCCKTVVYDSVLSRNIKIRYFLSQNFKVRYFLSRKVKIRARYEPKKWPELRYELTPDFIQPWLQAFALIALFFIQFFFVE